MPQMITVIRRKNIYLGKIKYSKNTAYNKNVRVTEKACSILHQHLNTCPGHLVIDCRTSDRSDALQIQFCLYLKYVIPVKSKVSESSSIFHAHFTNKEDEGRENWGKREKEVTH